MTMRAALLVLLAWAAPALAEPRFALVIGNGAYQAVAPLDNAVADAQLMAGTLERKGFTVTLLIDTGQADLKRGIGQFGRQLREAGADATGLFYYAGHGVQSFGANYLLPVDASLTDAADLGLVGVPADAILRQMYSARNKTNIVILDACRNNPFAAIPDLGDNGLAEMKAPTGTYLAYSTAPGAVALDGADGNSPFTRALAAEIDSPGAPIEQVFKQTRVAVLAATNGLQTPWDTSSLTASFSFTPAVVLSPEELAARQLWDSVRESRDPVQIMLFLRG
ncbi:caspase family protein [Paracoccaceae bacterium Fryx2]|nr:caspase family protein [Paracoccaceae bacterium Fryx2]